MQKFILLVFVSSVLFLIGCQPQTGNTNANLVNTNANVSNAFANNGNTNMTNTGSSVSVMEAKEPNEYQATVKMSLEALGEQQKATLPGLSANVARSGVDRRMEFALPTGEKVVYLDKAGTTYLILPNRKQYAELTQETLGFDVRRLLMPEEVVKRVENVKGVQRVGEEQMGGRTVIKYRYEGVANTQTQAGQVETESFLIIDKETGLPLRSETVSQSQTGGNVKGFKGFRVVTEMSDIKTVADASLFNAPTDLNKVDAQQVRGQANLIFQAVAALLGQAMQSAQQPPTVVNTNTNSATPAANR